MKRSIFIIAGIIFILVLLAIWIYVLFFATPKNTNDLFNDLSFGDTTDTTYVAEPVATEEVVIDVSGPQRLRQLTTKPIIGYAEVHKNASSSPEVYYVETGTGHVYSIDITSGKEERVSGTTFPASKKASISPNGQFVLIESGSGASAEFSVVKLESGKTTVQTINEPIIAFKATSDNAFLYAIQTGNSVIGKIYYPLSQSFETLFTLPFREATVLFGNSKTDTHYAYPKATSWLEGFLYAAKNGVLERVPVSGFGMSASGNNDYVYYSKTLGESYKSYLYNKEAGTSIVAPLTTLPEKCVADYNFPAETICAQQFSATYNASLPDSWYKGDASYADSLWDMNSNNGSATLLVDTANESGRALDIINLRISNNSETVFFMNKNDQTLWLYERLMPLEILYE